MKNADELCKRVCFSLFVLHAKSGTTNNHLNRSSDISFSSPFSRDSNEIFLRLEKHRFEFFIVSLISR